MWKKSFFKSTLKRWKKAQNLNVWKLESLVFERRNFFFFLGMCSFWIRAAWKCKASKSVHFPCACLVVHRSNSTPWKTSRVLQGIMVCNREYEYLSVSVEQLSSFRVVVLTSAAPGSPFPPVHFLSSPWRQCSSSLTPVQKSLLNSCAALRACSRKLAAENDLA